MSYCGGPEPLETEVLWDRSHKITGKTEDSEGCIGSLDLFQCERSARSIGGRLILMSAGRARLFVQPNFARRGARTSDTPRNGSFFRGTFDSFASPPLRAAPGYAHPPSRFRAEGVPNSLSWRDKSNSYRRFPFECDT